MNRRLRHLPAVILLNLLSAAALAEPNIANGQLIAVGGREGLVENACFRCHGIDGAGDSSGAFPRLTGQFAEYLTKQMHDYASGSRPNDIMTPIAQALSEQDWEDVSAYYAQLKAPDRGRNISDLSLLQRGADLSATGSQALGVQACVSCHGPAGAGLEPHFPYLAGQFASYIALQLRFWREGIRRNDPTGVMADIARRLNDEDIRAVSLYFESMQAIGSEETGSEPVGVPPAASPVR